MTLHLCNIILSVIWQHQGQTIITQAIKKSYLICINPGKFFLSDRIHLLTKQNSVLYDQITINRDYLMLEPIGSLFLVFFGSVMLVQFTGMLFHRMGTLTHLLSTVKLDWYLTKSVSVFYLCYEFTARYKIIGQIRRCIIFMWSLLLQIHIQIAYLHITRILALWNECRHQHVLLAPPWERWFNLGWFPVVR